jgi:hypothetical protein
LEFVLVHIKQQIDYEPTFRLVPPSSKVALMRFGGAYIVNMVANGNACKTNKFWRCTAKLLHILAVHHRRFGGAPPNLILVVFKSSPNMAEIVLRWQPVEKSNTSLFY